MLSQDEIKEIIPHQEPFLLLDEVTELEPGERVVAYKRVREDEYYFQGHFPGEPIMPGVLILEALAQAGAVATLALPENRGKMVLFAGLDEVRFKRKVVPGERLTVEVEVVSKRRHFGKGRAGAT
ncbi:3-hydroxyacyl-ACP dehydratase FabZ, partial [Candidatus Hakubella thermalkaliphila]|uniref:3-hydroxyacyl-ACP dehydratase FabZ n=1 Tax=Candidatus Hakubella thermalkaliphila TaxID=2754717 RepID=UPI0015934A88